MILVGPGEIFPGPCFLGKGERFCFTHNDTQPVESDYPMKAKSCHRHATVTSTRRPPEHHPDVEEVVVDGEGPDRGEDDDKTHETRIGDAQHRHKGGDHEVVIPQVSGLSCRLPGIAFLRNVQDRETPGQASWKGFIGRCL